nr:xylulose kinase-1 [Tanacetum cinerariifolium]
MNGLYIRYALTANPTINASVVRQFWGSALEVSLPDGVKGLVATIDSTAYTITEAFIRSVLQLDDLNAIDTMTNEKIFVGLRDIGRTLPSPSKSKSVALPFDEDDPKAKFNKHLRQVSDDDEPAEPDQWAIRSWRFYALLDIHVLETEAGDIIYMFVDKKYPLTPETIQRMLNHGLEIDRDLAGNDLTTAI